MRPMLSGLIALSGCNGDPGGGAYDLTLALRTADNQADLFDEIDEIEVRVETEGGEESFSLDAPSAGSSGSVIGTPLLEGATVSVVGYDGGEIVAFGRTQALDQKSGAQSVEVLFARVDDFAWLDMEEANALGAAAPTGGGGFLLFGGSTGSALLASGYATTDAVYELSIAPPDDLVLAATDAALPSLQEEYPPAADDEGSDTPGRLGLTATAIGDGRILLMGGASAFQEYRYISQGAWIWDAAAEEATDIAAPARSRAFHRAAVDSAGQVVLVGGLSQESDAGYLTPQENAEIYDPDSDTWTEVQAESTTLVGAGAAALGSEGVLACGGYYFVGDIEALNGCDLIGISGTIEAVDPFDEETGLVYPELTPLASGGVLLTGGFASPTGERLDQRATLAASARAWIYEDGEWTEVASMHNARAAHAAAALPDGRVLVAGGMAYADGPFYLDNPEPIACAEIYDPGADTWTEIEDGGCAPDDSAGALPRQVGWPAVAADPRYGVLVAGGIDDGEDAVGAAALFVARPDL